MVKQGDVIKINFNPNKGHEQAGYRPALVVSNNIYNNQTKMAILCEHVRAMDIYERGYKYIEKLPEDLLRRVAEIIGFEIEVI